MNPLNIYATDELLEAFQFYLSGPLSNTQLRDTLGAIRKELLKRNGMSKEQIFRCDELLDKYYSLDL